MKKYKILVIVILAGALSGWSGVKDVSAIVEEGGKKWYSMAEANEIGIEMERIAEERCGEDGVCRNNVYKNLINSNVKYKAANLMSGQMFTITSVNPGKSEVGFIYNGRVQYKFRKLDTMQTYPSKIYIGWYDLANKGLEGWSSLAYDFENEVDNLNILYKIKSASGEQVLPIDTEIKISNPEWGLSENPNGRMFYMVSNTDGSGFFGYFEYKKCLDREGYYEGGECRVMTNGISFDFFPIDTREVVEVERVVEIEKEVEKIVEVEKEVEKIVEVEKVVEIEKMVEVEKVVEVEVEKVVEVEKEVEKKVILEIEKFIETPIELTREIIVEKEVPIEKEVEVVKETVVEVPVERIVEKTVEVPVEVGDSNKSGIGSVINDNGILLERTLMVLVILGLLDGVILWWFWPIRQDNGGFLRKWQFWGRIFAKKSKKVLDKKTTLR